MHPKLIGIFGFVAWQVLAYTAAGIGAIASANATSFYRELDRPAWAPPAEAFGPVWSALFFLMGVAGWLVWRRGPSTATRVPIVLFLVQLVFNALWSWIFFEWRSGAWAFVDALVLWVSVAATAFAFARVHKVAAILLVPYLLWVTYAVCLTYAVWQRNPQAL